MSPPLDLDARILRVRNGSWSAHPDISALLARLDEAEELAAAFAAFLQAYEDGTEDMDDEAAYRAAHVSLARWRGTADG